MKKICLLFVCTALLLTSISCNESNAKSKINKDNLTEAKTRDLEIKKSTASIAFERTEHNFGTVNEGDIVETTFKIFNAGKTDLEITNAQGSCGCTVPKWPRKPIKPGESANVSVKFNTSGKPNRQTKTVTLTANTETGRHVLKLRGTVTPKTKKNAKNKMFTAIISLQTDVSSFTSMLPFLAMILVLYFFMIRPQMNRQKKEKLFQAEIKKGIRVVTSSGIHGKITEIHDADKTVTIETGAGKIKFERSAISMELSKRYAVSKK